MSKNGKRNLTWGQAIREFAVAMAIVFAVILLSGLTMWIPNILAFGYLLYILVWENPARD